MLKALVTYISVVICLLSSIDAMGEKMQFRHFTLDDGLSSNTVFSIVQDKTGFIWAGTREGLNRFDGKHYAIEAKGNSDKPDKEFGVTKDRVTRLSLNSDATTWQLKPQAEVSDSGAAIATAGYKFSNSVKGVVPGTVFTAYVDAGLEKTPEYADNIYRVDERKYNRPYWYRTEFVLKDKPERGQRVWLCFDNTNRFADFYFNGHKISGTPTSTKDVSGHMLRSKFDVTDYVATDRPNAVAVLIYDPDQKKTRNDKGPYGVACSPSYLAAAGWDWMPYVPGRLAGITGNAYVEVTGSAVMVDPWVRSQLPSLDKGEVSVSSDIKNTSSEAQYVTLSGTIMPGNINFSKTKLIKGGQTGNIHIDKNDFENLVIKNPRLWWPNGYGDPDLYQCKLQCSVDGEVTDTATVNFGIRKYSYRIEKNAVDYPVLQLYVNNQRIFVKGGDWGMSEYMLRCHGKDYEPKIRLHKDLNYNMIRLWTGCVTDDEFYDYCDRMGIMVWDDFWLYVAFNDVVQHDAFKLNALDKVRRLRNHACIAVWCGANETHPAADLDEALRLIVMSEDGNDRLYTSCSNQDAKSGSGWWKDLPPRHHFETSASNLAFNKPSYPYGIDHGYGFRSEIGMPCFPQYESVRLFIPKDKLWPLPTDDELRNDSGNVYNQHFFGKEASNADPVSYKHTVNDRYGEATGIEDFCDKAQLVNLEDMKGMYEAWNDKMWEDASALLIWMSHPAYPSFVWQTYDYYYDPTGCYWGAKKACEQQHVQWNCLTNSIKVINTTPQPLHATATAEVYDINGRKLWSRSQQVNVGAANKKEAFVIDWQDIKGLTPLHFLRLLLTDDYGKLISDNFYWRNGVKDLDYTGLQKLPDTHVKAELLSKTDTMIRVRLKNLSPTVAFALRLRLVDSKTGERVLPILMNDNYQTLMPGEETVVTFRSIQKPLDGSYRLLLKPFAHKERQALLIGKKVVRPSSNPVISGWYADPEAIVYGNKFWIYPTTSVSRPEQTYFDCFSSPDLVNWTKHPRILSTDEVKWAKKEMWAPAVISANGKYYFFFGANDVHQGEIGGIGVAVADKPEGPYHDALGKPLIGNIVNGAQPIDQMVFRDDDGSYYMYYGGWGHCNVVKLADDLLSLVPFPDGTMYKEITPSKDYVEGPYMIKRKGKYYFMWSEGGWGLSNYCVAYAVGDSPIGPFVNKGKILQQDLSVATGTGHNSVVRGAGDDEWYIVYHRRPLGETKDSHRVVCIDKLLFDKDGNIIPVKPTFEGVGPTKPHVSPRSDF